MNVQEEILRTIIYRPKVSHLFYELYRQNGLEKIRTYLNENIHDLNI